jgi:hypothetical protein
VRIGVGPDEGDNPDMFAPNLPDEIAQDAEGRNDLNWRGTQRWREQECKEANGKISERRRDAHVKLLEGCDASGFEVRTPVEPRAKHAAGGE